MWLFLKSYFCDTMPRKIPPPKISHAWKIEGAPLRFAKIVTPWKKLWKGNEKPWKPREKTVNTRKIRFVQKGWFCDFVPTISHICSRSMWLLLILWWGNCKLFNLWLSLLWSFRSFIQTAALNSSSRLGTVIRYSELCCALVLPNFFFGLARLLFEVRFCLPVEKMVARLPSWLPSLLKYWS